LQASVDIAPGPEDTSISLTVGNDRASKSDLCHLRKSIKVYDSVMKYVFLAIFVLIAAQPMQVSSCKMHDTQQASHSGSHDMNHDDGQDMDCCDHDPSVPSDSCDSVSHCGATTAGVMAFSSIAVNVIFNSNSRLYQSDTGEPLSRFKSPPYKPPIA